jgi:hypothetical protein
MIGLDRSPFIDPPIQIGERMATVIKKEVPQRSITEGERLILDALRRFVSNDYSGDLNHAIKNVDAQKNTLAGKRADVVEAEGYLVDYELKLREAKKKVADMVNDLGRLNCPIEAIKRCWPDFNAHDVAEWTTY